MNVKQICDLIIDDLNQLHKEGRLTLMEEDTQVMNLVTKYRNNSNATIVLAAGRKDLLYKYTWKMWDKLSRYTKELFDQFADVKKTQSFLMEKKRMMENIDYADKVDPLDSKKMAAAELKEGDEFKSIFNDLVEEWNKLTDGEEVLVRAGIIKLLQIFTPFATIVSAGYAVIIYMPQFNQGITLEYVIAIWLGLMYATWWVILKILKRKKVIPNQ